MKSVTRLFASQKFLSTRFVKQLLLFGSLVASGAWLVGPAAGQDQQEAGASEQLGTSEQLQEIEAEGGPVSDQPTRAIRFNLFQRSQEPVTRAKRPTFLPRDTERLYFSDYFSQALQGPPPDWSSLQTNIAGSGMRPASPGDPARDVDLAKPFDLLISSDVIEDLVKRNVNVLTTQITTPGRFRSEYSTVHQTYVQLAALFAVNEHYGADIRWKDSAATYRTMLARTSAGTRVGTEQAYQLAVRTRDDLQQILRGERPNIDVVVEPLEDWSTLLYRSPLMIWLEDLTQEQMRPLLSDNNSIRANQTEVTQQAEQVAMIAQLLSMPQMEGHDEEAYSKHLQAMKAAVGELKAAYTRQDFPDVGTAFNRITQSCDACHEDYR